MCTYVSHVRTDKLQRFMRTHRGARTRYDTRKHFVPGYVRLRVRADVRRDVNGSLKRAGPRQWRNSPVAPGPLSRARVHYRGHRRPRHRSNGYDHGARIWVGRRPYDFRARPHDSVIIFKV